MKPSLKVPSFRGKICMGFAGYSAQVACDVSSCTLPILFRDPSLQKTGNILENRWFLKRTMGEENAESNLRMLRNERSLGWENQWAPQAASCWFPLCQDWLGRWPQNKGGKHTCSCLILSPNTNICIYIHIYIYMYTHILQSTRTRSETKKKQEN